MPDECKALPLDAHMLPSVPHIPAEILALGENGLFPDAFAFHVGPTTSNEAFPVPAFDQHCIVIRTQGVYESEALIEGEYCRAHTDPGGANALSLVPAGMQSAWRVCDGQGCSTNLYVSPSLLARVAIQALDMEPARAILTPQAFFQDTLLTWTGLALAYTMRNREPGSMLSYEWLCQELAGHLLARHAWSPASIPVIRGQLPGPVLKQVLDYIEAEPAADLRLGPLAALAHMSEFHFARLFRKTVGRTVHQVVLERRLKTSYGMVLNTQLGLAQVAAEAGFADESHFVKRFQRCYGITPGELRRNARLQRSKILQDNPQAFP